MWLRRAYYGWLTPAAFVLPLWLLAGWAVTGAGGWAFLWVMLAMPAVFVTQLVLMLLVRARSSARSRRAVSWWDVLGFTVWHGLVIALGFFAEAWWGAIAVLAVIVAVGLVWLQLWQLWREAKDAALVFRTPEGLRYLAPAQQPPPTRERDVFVVTERRLPES